MDTQELINWTMTAMGALIGYVVNSIRTEVEILRKRDEIIAEKVNSIEILVAGNYAKKDELMHMVNKLETKIESGFNKVFEKLDEKEDKKR